MVWVGFSAASASPGCPGCHCHDSHEVTVPASQSHAQHSTDRVVGPSVVSCFFSSFFYGPELYQFVVVVLFTCIVLRSIVRTWSTTSTFLFDRVRCWKKKEKRRNKKIKKKEKKKNDGKKRGKKCDSRVVKCEM